MPGSPLKRRLSPGCRGSSSIFEQDRVKDVKMKEKSNP
jgi:hypothetical protein